MKKTTCRKFIIRCLSFFIFICTTILIIILAMMMYPLYGHFFNDHTGEERLATINVNGVDSQYIFYDTLWGDSIVSELIKGELYEKSGNYAIYRWALEPDKSYKYFLFEYIGPIKQDDSVPIDVRIPESMIPIKKHIRLYKLYEN